MALLWEALEKSANADLAAIAAKSQKEVRYHLRHSRDWLVRLGDGSDESHARSQASLDHLFPYTQEFWAHSPAEAAAVEAGIGVDVRHCRPTGMPSSTLHWPRRRCTRPAVGGYITEGKQGVHSEHLGFLLAEMQSLARAHPNGVW
jgi:ring-1,2-phenylacetyl-CoA epoxidase subunit PaaC